MLLIIKKFDYLTLKQLLERNNDMKKLESKTAGNIYPGFIVAIAKSSKN